MISKIAYEVNVVIEEKKYYLILNVEKDKG